MLYLLLKVFVISYLNTLFIFLQLCQQALRCVQRCLYVQQGGDVGSFEVESAQNFSEQVATKMILILLLLMTKLEEKGQSKDLLKFGEK